MRRLLSIAILGAVVGLAGASRSAQAQIMLGGPTTTYRAANVYTPPGSYGTSWGVASYKTPRTYSSFSSPYGAGYGSGYAPYGVMPGRYGVGLWRPAAGAPGYYYGSSGYATYAKPFRATGAVYGPPMGAYAPGFGPGLPPMMIGN